MVTFPVRLLLTAYGGSFLAGVWCQMSGMSGLGTLAVFWLGGAGSVFVLPALPGIGAAFRSRTTPDDAVTEWRREREFDRWEADLARERVETTVAVEDAAHQADAADAREAPRATG